MICSRRPFKIGSIKKATPSTRMVRKFLMRIYSQTSLGSPRKLSTNISALRVGMQWLGKILLSIIIAIAAGSAPVRWPEIDSGTCLLKSSVALQRSQYQVTERLHRGKRRRCKTPQHHHTNRFIHQQQQLPPPRRRSKWKTCFSECH